MSTIPTQRVRARTTTILPIPLTDSAGQAVQAAGLTTLTATMTSVDTGAPVDAMQARDVKAALVDGVLSLELTPADLAMLTSREIERRIVTLSATYGAGAAKEWHVEVPLEVEGLVGVS